jgi:hypothetical protein
MKEDFQTTNWEDAKKQRLILRYFKFILE